MKNILEEKYLGLCQAPFLAPALSSAGPGQTQRLFRSSSSPPPCTRTSGWRCPSGDGASNALRRGRLLEGAALGTCPFCQLLRFSVFPQSNMAVSSREHIPEDCMRGKDPRYVEKIPPKTRKDVT